jgi:hypothetical protein
MLTDFHIHSNFSDGKHSIPEIVDFYGRRGFGAIAITDHLCETESFLGIAAGYLERTLTPATFPLYLEILKSEQERAKKLYGMIVIPGFEITKNSLSNHRSAHMLALGVTEFVSANGDIETILQKIRAQGALTIAAHPVSTGKMEKQTLHLWSRREELAHLFDAWEVASGPRLFDEVGKSGLPMLANTDLHRFSQINAWKTVMNCERHPEAILQAIREQKLSFRFYEDTLTHQEDTPHVIPFPTPHFSRSLELVTSAYGRRNFHTD